MYHGDVPEVNPMIHGRRGEILWTAQRNSPDGSEKFSAWLGKQVGADFGLENDLRLRQEPLRTADQGVLRVVPVETVDVEPRLTQVQATEEAGEAPILLPTVGNERCAERTEVKKHEWPRMSHELS